MLRAALAPFRQIVGGHVPQQLCRERFASGFEQMPRQAGTGVALQLCAAALLRSLARLLPVEIFAENIFDCDDRARRSGAET